MAVQDCVAQADRDESLMSQPRYQLLLQAEELPVGRTRCFDLGEHQVLLCHTKEGFFAVHNICSHAYARLDEGRLRGTRVICPLHGASFDVRDGSVKGPPAYEGIRSYPVRVTDGRVEVALD